jgi:predicted permease
MFSVVSGVLLKPPPLRDPDRILMVWGYYPQADLGMEEQPLHGRHVAAIRDQTRAFAAVAAFRPRAYNLADGATPERLDGTEVTGDFFTAIGVGPQLGRLLTRADEAPGSNRVVVLSDGLWRRRFGADPSIVGRTIRLNAEAYVVAGVAPAGFAFPRGAELPAVFQFPAASELWVPIEPPQRGVSDFAGIARLRSGVTREAAADDLARITAALEERFPEAKGWFETRVAPLQQQLTGGVAPTLWMLLGAVGLVLLVACVNTAQLFLARNQARRRDLAVRAALGASGRRLATEILAETIAVVTLAGAIGAGLGAAGLVLVRVHGSSRLPRLAELTFDLRSAVVAVLATLLAAVVAGAIPVLAGRGEGAADALRQAGRGAGGRGLSSRSRRLLVAAEVALSVVLVAGAGLLIRSLARQLGADTGFTAPHGVTFEVTLPPVAYPERQFTTYMEHPRAVAFFTEALARIRAIPGVDAAAIGKPLPLSGAQEASGFTAEGVETGAPDDGPGTAPAMAEYTVASEDMLRALGTPLLAGRDFTSTDRETSPRVTIVNQSMARRVWPGQSAIGKRIHLGGPGSPAPWMTVIGVAADLKRYSLIESPRPEMLVPYTQHPYPSFATMQFVIRSTLATDRLLPSVRRAIAQVDSDVPVSKVRTIDDLIGETTANARFATRLMTAFGVAALGLAMIGLYGVIAYSVHQRRQEFGVRRALGATRGGIVRLVLREGLTLASVGLGLGTAGALAAGRSLRHLLYEVSAFDPATLGATIALLAVAAAAASFFPASRASRVEPRVALED